MSFSHKKLYVIFPAAGSGSRMRSDKNKLLLEVGGRTVIDRTLGAFNEFAQNNGIELTGILVVSPGSVDQWHDYITNELGYTFIRDIIEGGATRTESVRSGVMCLDASDFDEPIESDDIVFIHDAARCMIDQDSIRRCFEAMQSENMKVCVSGVKTKNTIKMVKTAQDGSVTVESTPDRDLLYEVQTPQCFKAAVLMDCYERAAQEEFEATDDTALAEHYGIEVSIIEGSYSNIKITTPEDILIAQSLLHIQN